METTNAIITNLGNEHFVIIVDEAHDISNKEQMAIALHYVNKSGSIVECFLGIVHVKDTTTLSLEMAIDELICIHVGLVYQFMDKVMMVLATCKGNFLVSKV